MCANAQTAGHPFHYLGTMGRSNTDLNDIDLNDIIKLIHPENLRLGASAKFETYLLYESSYSHFCIHISKFSLPWQQRSVRASLNNASKLANPVNPILWYINDLSLIQAEL